MIALAGNSEADDAASLRRGNLCTCNRLGGDMTIEVRIVLTPIREIFIDSKQCVSGTGPSLVKGETKSP